ncbi:hypothetical protein M5K25_004130 [Dendrobium thyrsiflorum]|uniref:DUF4283 domain-containing protein n=1 Tax=Dendrobium thyrsiflorum TaxID=117978 RepID=A0ABD0VLX2_DENTH
MAVDRIKDPGFLDGKVISRSFKDALYGESSSPVFPPLKVSSHHGLPALIISEEEMLSLVLPFEFALIGKFAGHRLPLDLIRKFFFNLKLFGDFSVSLLNPKNVLIKLVNDLDYCRVFSHRSYFVSNCFMWIFKWSPHFDVNVESPIVSIWVSFPSLRPHLFSPQILHGLGSLFGRPLRTDNSTVNGLRPSVSRILVELDVTKRNVSQVWLGSENCCYVQPVSMKEFLLYCFHCKSLGHSKECCPVLFPEVGVVSAVKETNASVDVLKDPPDSCLPTDNAGGGNLGDVVVTPVCDEGLMGNVVVPSLLCNGVSSPPQCNVSWWFCLPQINTREPSVEVDEISALVVSNVDTHRDDLVTCGFETGNNIADGVVSNDSLGVSMLPSLVGNAGDMEMPLLGGPEGALVDVPLVVISPKDLLAQFVYPSGITCSGFSDRDDAPSSPSSGEGDGFGDDHSFQDLYGLNVGKAVVKPIPRASKRRRRKSRK